MKRLAILGVILATILLFGVVSSNVNQQNTVQTNGSVPATVESLKKITPTCDGTVVMGSCTLDGVNYKTYIYHPAVEEKTHNEIITTYQEKVTGYCTLCNDGTYSPSCATGRGACSHHGGVAQWNAPMTSNVPVNSTKNVVDAVAQEAYYEKVAD